MALVSPRLGKDDAISQAASVPIDWDDDVEHRRKLAEAIKLLAEVLRELAPNPGSGFSTGFTKGFG